MHNPVKTTNFCDLANGHPGVIRFAPDPTPLPCGVGARIFHSVMTDFLLYPDPQDPRLTERVAGVDHEGNTVETSVVVERPLTLFLNSQEIVTMMTIADYPDYLAVGFLLNQNMLQTDDEITGIDYDEELEVVVVRTKRQTDYEEKLKKKVRTSGCAQGTVFGDLMENFETIDLPKDAQLKTSWLYALTKKINGLEILQRHWRQLA